MRKIIQFWKTLFLIIIYMPSWKQNMYIIKYFDFEQFFYVKYFTSLIFRMIWPHISFYKLVFLLFCEISIDPNNIIKYVYSIPIQTTFKGSKSIYGKSIASNCEFEWSRSTIITHNKNFREQWENIFSNSYLLHLIYVLLFYSMMTHS